MKMKKVLLFLAVLFCSLMVNAQFSLEYALEKVEYRTLPFSNEQTKSIRKKWPIKNNNNLISDKLYTNFQLTEYFLARDIDEMRINLVTKFKMRNNLTLALLDIDGNDPMTFCLIAIDNSNNIKSTLEVGVKSGLTKCKQFRITADEKIIVTQFVTTERVSVKMDSFSKVTGYITETVYHIDASGKFVEESKKQCTGFRTFTREQLENPSTDLWDLY